MNTPYTQKAIDVTLTLGKGRFGTSGSSSVKLSGLRVIATIQKAGAPSFDHGEIRIFGMKQSMMNQLSTLGIPLTEYRPNNSILIEAGDAVNGMSTVFNGAIGNAWQDLDGAPEVFFQVVFWSGARGAAMTPVPPTSVQNQTDVATVMAALAKQAGFAFENNGVSVQLASTYLPGSALDQIHKLAAAADVVVYIDSGTNPPTLAIWPRFGTRGGTSPVISPDSGMIGYPKFASNGMTFRCLYNPALKLGGNIMMKSSITPASGQWSVIGPLTHNLASMTPGGPWFSDVSCARTADVIAAAS